MPSLVLAVEPAESGLRGGVPAVYYSTISWSSKNTPIAPEVYPRAVFERLFDTSGLLRDKSVLDAVLSQSKDLRKGLGGHDQQKLDEFMHSVRDLEQRIERATKEERLEGWRPTLAKPDMQRPAAELPQDVREHMRMMLDLILLAWRMDKTRVATLIFNRDVSHMKFGFLDGVLNDQLHGISHHKEDPRKLASYQRINQFHVEQLAYLMKQMQAVDEGGGTTMLDNVILQFGSNMFNGDSHDGRNLPMILAGHCGGSISGGRVIDTGAKSEEQQRACNLYLGIAQRMGLKLDRFGDSTEMRGVAGLKAWLKSREDEFLANFHRKLLGYALGRAVLPGDRRLLERMNQDGDHFASLVECIVTSPQFTLARRRVRFPPARPFTHHHFRPTR